MDNQGRKRCAKVISNAFSPVCIFDDFMPVLYLPCISLTPPNTQATPRPAVGGSDIAKLVAANLLSSVKFV